MSFLISNADIMEWRADAEEFKDIPSIPLLMVKDNGVKLKLIWGLFSTRRARCAKRKLFKVWAWQELAGDAAVYKIYATFKFNFFTKHSQVLLLFVFTDYDGSSCIST